MVNHLFQKSFLVAICLGAIQGPINSNELLSQENNMTSPAAASFKVSGSPYTYSLSSVETSSFIQSISSKVLETIDHAQDLPGFTPEALDKIRAPMREHWTSLVENGVLIIEGTDADIRPWLVALQAIVEHVMAHELGESIRWVKGIIHTPTPATPLCTEGVPSLGLVDPSIAEDPARLLTVQVRAIVIRNLLARGATIQVVYPSAGMNKRKPEQQQIYRETLATYPTQLCDLPIDRDIPTELIGATYTFTGPEGKPCVFAVNITQANDPQTLGRFGLWFGDADKAPIKERLSAVQDYIGI